MHGEDSASSVTAIDVSTASLTAVTLSKFDVTALRRDFERLSVDDLTALASFPVEPHELIGRVVAVTHCLLLSLAVEHTALELRAPPWPLLRLQLLDNTKKIWRKLRKRAWQLETGVKSLAPVQIRFGWKELVPFILPPKHESHHYQGAWQLESLAQVSTIAASLGAWVVFCLCCSVLPSPSTSLRCSEVAPPPEFQDSIHPLPSVKLSPRHRSPRKRDPARSATSSSPSNVLRHYTALRLEPITAHTRLLRVSRRIGIKIGGRFLLYHIRFPGCTSSRFAVDSVDPLGEWSAFCLDVNRIGQQPRLEQGVKSYSANASWWKPSRAIETKPSRSIHPLALCHMTPFAQHSLLLLLGIHEHIFERPAQEIPHIKTPSSLPPVFTLKFDVVATDLPSQLSLLGVGNVLIALETTVADLRSQVTPSIASRLCNLVDRQVTFHFMYRGSLLAVSQERHLAAIVLLPFAVLVVADNNQVKEYRRGGRASQLWRHHCEVAQALVNAGLPDHIPNAPSLQVPRSATTFPTTPQVYAMRQPLSAPGAGASTCSEIVEVFTHWQAFVYFQQLQDSSVLFPLHQRSPKKRSKSPKHRLNKDREDARNESVQYGPQPQLLPRKKFNSNKEWLLPLYAVVDVASPTTAVLKTPYRQYVEHILAQQCRFVLAEEVNVIHFTRINCVNTERDDFGINAVFDIAFLRDESCPLETLIALKGAYVWLIVPRMPHNNGEAPAVPTEWMLDLHRFVQHPMYDSQWLNCEMLNHFRVRMPWDLAERAIEAAFWSKDVNWNPSVNSTDLYSTVLRQIFDALCRSHPPAFGVDSVKFSKLLYEAKIQPTLLGIGDAAFLFESNLTPGFTYEMDFDGFVRAVEWLAQRFYSENGTKGKTGPSKTVPGVQHAMIKWQHSRRGDHGARDCLLSSLRRFCYETLVHLPNLNSTWHEIMDSWRLVRKQQLLQEYALKYCAATRLRATWIGFVSWRIFLRQRQRMKDERLAATKLQSLARGRKRYLEYHRARRIVIRTQLRIYARSELRRLRAERAAFAERMRVRMVKWTRHHLWLLGEWKSLNAEKAARRDRIREKRLRRLGVGVFPLDTWRVCFSLYRAKSVAPTDTEESATASNGVEIVSKNAAEHQGGSNEAYELEVVDLTRSWGRLFCVSQQQIDQFIAEEIERQEIQLQLGFTTVSMTAGKQTSSYAVVQDKLPLGRNQESAIKRDSVVYPVLKLNESLLALARRLFILKDSQQNPVGLRCYSDPADSSLGKLVFKGAVRSELAHDTGQLLVQLHVVRILEWAGTFKFIMYTPATSSRRRYDLAASFILAVLQFSRFQSMCLSIPDGEDNVVAVDKEEQLRASASKTSASELLQFVPHQIHRVLNGSHKVLALQCILSYVLKYGTRTPSYSMMPHVIAERERQRQKRESEQRNIILNRERQLIVKVQARLRRHLARKTRLQLALASYSKQFDRESGRFVYVVQYQSGAPVVLDERKPFSLFDQDVPLPPDEWQLVAAADNDTRFFNPQRGVYNRYNDVLAATAIQRWFRGRIWDGINSWELLDIAHAVRYHSNVHKTTNMADRGQLENIKRYALQLHVLEHQYKAAYSIYEAALKLSPNDPQTLVCLATLLVISCRYPVAQSWQRAMVFLQQARDLVGDDFTSTLQEVEQNSFRWALFLQPKNPHAIANYAVYLQCIHLDVDKAELLYRRALDLDPANDLFVTNFQRLQSERAPGRIYSFAGPGKTALARSSEVRRCGSESQWREMKDPEAQPPMLKRFFHHLRTGKCTWELPTEDQSLVASPDPSEISPDSTNTSC